jgi:hypothetical protein
MTTTLWLRISAVVSLLFTLGHTMGGRKQWSPMGDNPVLESMRTVPFQAMGASRTYLDFYMGFGWSISVLMLLETILLWQLGSLARTEAARLRPMIAAFAVATAATCAIAWVLIFPLPAAFAAVLFVCLAVAFAMAR